MRNKLAKKKKKIEFDFSKLRDKVKLKATVIWKLLDLTDIKFPIAPIVRYGRSKYEGHNIIWPYHDTVGEISARQYLYICLELAYKNEI